MKSTTLRPSEITQSDTIEGEKQIQQAFGNLVIKY